MRLIKAEKLYEKSKKFDKDFRIKLQMILSTTDCDYDTDKVIVLCEKC